MTMHTIFGPWTSDDLAVLEVAEGEWRVSDLRNRRPQGAAFVGIVRLNEAIYYATHLPLDHAARGFATLESAVVYLEDEYLAQLFGFGDGFDLDDTMPWPPPPHDR